MLQLTDQKQFHTAIKSAKAANKNFTLEVMNMTMFPAGMDYYEQPKR